MYPKLSIIIPAYNCASTIKRCIDSLLIQKCAELEIIIVNDGSSDNLLDVLKEYNAKIKLISTENGGVAQARNEGIKRASGDFLMFIDADDALAPDALETVLQKVAQTNADIVRFSYKLIYPNGKTSLPLNRFEQELFIEKKDFKDEIYKNYITGIKLNSICMTLFKSSIVKKLSFRKDMKTAEDAIFSLQAYTRAQSVLLLPNAFYLYYQTGSSLTGSSLPVFEKYKYNFVLSKEIMRHLPVWCMNTPYWYIRAFFRPLLLTFDKLNRLKTDKKATKNAE